ncbi:MAG: hypothetical protein WC975_06555 [Phycisphaerae bacterium]
MSLETRIVAIEEKINPFDGAPCPECGRKPSDPRVREINEPENDTDQKPFMILKCSTCKSLTRQYFEYVTI